MFVADSTQVGLCISRAFSLFVAGCGRLGSNGVTVFAPVMPHANAQESTLGHPLPVTVTVMVPLKGLLATAHHSPTARVNANDAKLQQVACVLCVNVKPGAVGVSKLLPVTLPSAATIMTSFGFEVVSDTEPEVVDEKWLEFEPSIINPNACTCPTAFRTITITVTSPGCPNADSCALFAWGDYRSEHRQPVRP